MRAIAAADCRVREDGHPHPYPLPTQGEGEEGGRGRVGARRERWQMVCRECEREGKSFLLTKWDLVCLIDRGAFRCPKCGGRMVEA